MGTRSDLATVRVCINWQWWRTTTISISLEGYRVEKETYPLSPLLRPLSSPLRSIYRPRSLSPVSALFRPLSRHLSFLLLPPAKPQISPTFLGASDISVLGLCDGWHVPAPLSSLPLAPPFPSLPPAPIASPLPWSGSLTSRVRLLQTCFPHR